jgi:hypothetical protein
MSNSVAMPPRISIAASAVLSAAGWFALWSVSSVSGPEAMSSSQDRPALADLASLPVTQIENYGLVFTAAQPNGLEQVEIRARRNQNEKVAASEAQPAADRRLSCALDPVENRRPIEQRAANVRDRKRGCSAYRAVIE